MLPILIDTTSAASYSSTASLIVSRARGDVKTKIFPSLAKNQQGPVIIQFPSENGTMTATLYFEETVSPREREFMEQKKAFEEIPPLLLAQYEGQFVISYNGQIVDNDADLDALVGRFFNQHGDIPVYLEKIGGDLEVRIDTPFTD